jgi:hypothetical protein
LWCQRECELLKENERAKADLNLFKKVPLLTYDFDDGVSKTYFYFSNNSSFRLLL